MIRTVTSKGQAIDADRQWESKLKQRQEELKYKSKVNPEDPRYYKIKANFNYLLNYDLQVVSEIGRGGYGVVYRGILTEGHQSKKQVAIKINFKTVAKEITYIQTALLILCRKERNLPKLVNVMEYDSKTHIVTEYFPYTHFIDLFTKLKLEDIKHYLIELLYGLKSLKDKGIYHRDIKPGNFLYNVDKKSGIIIDFGLAEIDPHYQPKLNKEDIKKMRKPQKKQYQLELTLYERLHECLQNVGRHKIGTEAFMPIESLLRHPKQNYESDIWAVGVILLEFVLKKYNIFNHLKEPKGPQGENNELSPKATYLMYYLIQLATFFGREAVMAQCRKLGYYLQLPENITVVKISEVSLLQGYNEDLQNLLFSLLELDLDKRIKVEDAIKHRFFDSVRSQHAPKKK